MLRLRIKTTQTARTRTFIVFKKGYDFILINRFIFSTSTKATLRTIPDPSNMNGKINCG